MAPIPRQASMPLKASDGDRQPLRRDTSGKFCFDAGSSASSGTREEEEEEEGLPALAMLPCMRILAELSSARDPGRGLQQPQSKSPAVPCLTGQHMAGTA